MGIVIRGTWTQRRQLQQLSQRSKRRWADAQSAGAQLAVARVFGEHSG